MPRLPRQTRQFNQSALAKLHLTPHREGTSFTIFSSSCVIIKSVSYHLDLEESAVLLFADEGFSELWVDEYSCLSPADWARAEKLFEEVS